MYRNIQTSVFDSLPVVTFKNNHQTPPTRVVWVCTDVPTAELYASKLREMSHISDIEITDALVKG